MKKYIIGTGSITYAIKGRDLLRSMGARARIERNVSSSGNNGCGYSIIFEGDIASAEKALRSAGVKILQIKEV